jgi:hypothetical protein
MYYVEFRSLSASPEQTVKDISAAVRAARARTHPLPAPACAPASPPTRLTSLSSLLYSL